MILNIMNRLYLMNNFLPKEGDIKQMTICKSIGKKIEIDLATLDRCEFKRDEKGNLSSPLTWNIEKEEVIDFDFSEEEKGFLKVLVQVLDSEKKVTPDNLDLCASILAM